MLRVPGLSITTRHSPSAYPWQAQATLPGAGVVIGLNHLGGGAPFCYDPWALYEAEVVRSPNLVLLGQLGTGKSSLVKTYLARQSLAGRQVFVLDPKGEYAPLADQLGLAQLCLRPGGQHRLNPLDRWPGSDLEPSAVVADLAGAGLRRDLSPEERAGLEAATNSLPSGATLAELVDALLHPGAGLTTALSMSVPQALAALRPMGLELGRLLRGDLAGMFDGATNVALDPEGPGLRIDLSAVFGTGAGPAVMVAAGSWLSQVTGRPSERRRILVLDEAWAALGNVTTTRWLQATAKLARARGIQLVLVVHRLSDLAAQADAGTEAAAQAQGLLADAETRVVYAQSPGELAAATALLGLSGAEAELVGRLPPFVALWLVGHHRAVIEHVCTEAELAMVNTDQAMS
ncbi:MAG TPA: hypothetical protein VNF50_05300 [Acidimicrobiales bacterium]|nr:hypothetical protein [Acidimicrobiales bacterium]